MHKNTKATTAQQKCTSATKMHKRNKNALRPKATERTACLHWACSRLPLSQVHARVAGRANGHCASALHEASKMSAVHKRLHFARLVRPDTPARSCTESAAKGHTPFAGRRGARLPISHQNEAHDA